MKKLKRTRTARRLAGGLALLLILGLLLSVDCLTGDPVSRAFANRRMLAWANQRWPGNDFYIAEQFGGPCFTYDVRLQSASSADTWFSVGSVLGLWGYRSDYETQVEGGYNTRHRLEQALESAANACLQERGFTAQYQPKVYAALGLPGPDGTRKLPEGLALDTPYDPALARQATLLLQIATNGPPDAALARRAAADAKLALEAGGLSFAGYELTLHDGTAGCQQSPDTLLEKAFTAQELG